MTVHFQFTYSSIDLPICSVSEYFSMTTPSGCEAMSGAANIHKNELSSEDSVLSHLMTFNTPEHSRDKDEEPQTKCSKDATAELKTALS